MKDEMNEWARVDRESDAGATAQVRVPVRPGMREGGGEQ